jgi:hypothetical protein
MEKDNIEQTNNIDLVELQKMIFIYNALKTGWSVKMLKEGKFEFKKTKNNIKKEVFLDDYLKKFIQFNLNIENLSI